MIPLRVHQSDSREDAGQALASHLATIICAALATGRRARIALSGGSSPEPAYRALARTELDWSRVDIALVDERWVDPDSDGSNEAMVRRAFEQAHGVTIHGMKGPLPDPRGAAAEALDPIYASLRPFDAIVLGMGPDLHTASWFEGSPELAACLDRSTHASVLGVEVSKAPVGAAFPLRMTITLPVVEECPDVSLLMFGQDKIELLERRLEAPAAASVTIAPIQAAMAVLQDRFAVYWAP
jgi:6-phosphogluconolactonase